MAEAAPSNATLGATLYGTDTAAATTEATTATTTAATTEGATTAAEGATTTTETKAEGTTEAAAEGILTKIPAEGETKTEGEAATAPVLTVESYKDLALPDGLTVDEPMFGKFKSLAAELGIPPEAAPKLLALQKEFQESQASALTASMQAQDATWSKELDTIPEFQGPNRAKAQEVIGRMITEFGSPEVRTLLGTYGLANNPVLARWIYSMGQAMVEADAAPVGQPVRTGANGRRLGSTLGEILYGDPNAATQ